MAQRISAVQAPTMGGTDRSLDPAAFKRLAAAAIVCQLSSTLAVVLMHVLRPDLEAAKHFLSEYALGPYSWVMTASFVAASAGCLCLSLGLRRSGLVTVLATCGQALFAIAGAGLLVSAICPMDSPQGPSTTTGEIHDISFLVNVTSLFLAEVLTSFAFGVHPRWRAYRRIALALAAVVLACFVLQFATLRKGAPYGLANRAFAMSLMAWLLVTTIRLRALARR